MWVLETHLYIQPLNLLNSHVRCHSCRSKFQLCSMDEYPQQYFASTDWYQTTIAAIISSNASMKSIASSRSSEVKSVKTQDEEQKCVILQFLLIFNITLKQLESILLVAVTTACWFKNIVICGLLVDSQEWTGNNSEWKENKYAPNPLLHIIWPHEITFYLSIWDLVMPMDP